MTVEDLPQSRLGTKEYWDSVYACVDTNSREVATFTDIGDEGEVWFGEESVDRMVRYLVDFLEDAQEKPHILDLGMGNGHLLFSIAEEEDLADKVDAERMLGVDYSRASVDLAKAVGAARGGECEAIRFQEADLRDADCVKELAGSSSGYGWDIVCDKGTVCIY
ncbi:N-acetylphosphatidylethanolamine-hydrolyzing phospholipase D [Malassezia cuniculi]|uniref:N-acetylphosphatidylethanolamine-hydrolyzing phospholipase D n=1 Tax=Malassezia cuniculi TaxID=948313 RepID=A0AAF0J583_9BASI|nr:N-acetylphosphatidylethanolamine-hydrolyzing phospholipase D [Malassezia cuniculi]